MVAPAHPTAERQARPSLGLDPAGQALEGSRPARRAPVGDLGDHGQALADRRAAVVGHPQGPDQLVVELVVPEALHPDGTADDIGVFEGHGALFLGDAPDPAGGRRRSLCPMPAYPVTCAWPPSRRRPEPTGDANLAAAGGLVAEAAADGATLVVLPEYFSVAGSPDVLRAGAEPLDGPTMTWASATAARLGIHLVAGSFPERPGRGPGRPAGQHQLPRRARRVDARPSTARSTCSTSPCDGVAFPRVGHHRPRRPRWCVAPLGRPVAADRRARPPCSA